MPKPAPKMYKLLSLRGGGVDYTIRANDQGSAYDGESMYDLSYCEGDFDAMSVGDRKDADWMTGVPAMTPAQWASFCIWMCSPGNPGSPYRGE